MNALDQTSIMLTPEDAPSDMEAGGYSSAQPERKPMSDEEFQSIVATRIENAIAYSDGQLGPDRARGTRFYRGDVSQELPQKRGRSGVVSRDLRDVVQDTLPSLMRIFGAGSAVQFKPRGPEDEPKAGQATDYCDYLFRERNNGFMVLHSAFKDTLINRCGPVKVWWHEETTIEAKQYSGLDEMTLQAFLADAQQSGAEISELTQDWKGLYGFTWTRQKPTGRVCVEAMPPEELIYSPGAKDLERPLLIGQYTTKTVGELVAMGYDYAEMVELASPSERKYDEEALDRRPNGQPFEDDSGGDPTGQDVEYIEAYTLIDRDGDGIPEMRRVCCAGPGRKVLDESIVDDHPFAVFLMEPEPHTPEGLSMADCLDDIQLIRTHLMRLGLDGLSSILSPRLTYTSGVNLAQLRDPVSHVHVPQGEMVTPLPTDKAAPEQAMTWYRAFGDVRADRTGQNQASMGLEADALQSVSRIASNALVQRAQGRLELIARILAETGYKRVMKLILRCVTRYQQQEDIIQLRGTWVPMTPQNWHPDMDVKVNVGLGTGNTEERLMSAQTMLQVQQAIMQAAGPDNPWTDPELIRNSLEDLAEAQGKAPSRYFLTTEAWQKKQAEIAQQPKGPPPESELVQAERIKAQLKAKTDSEKIKADQDASRDKLIADAMAKAMDAAIMRGADPVSAAQYAQLVAQVIQQQITQPRVDYGTQMQPGQTPPAPNKMGQPDIPPMPNGAGGAPMPPGMQ